MKFWLLSLIMMSGISLTMCACGHGNNEPIQKEVPTPDPNPNPTPDPEPEPTTGNGKALVAYFSCTNTTKGIADDVADITSGTLMPIIAYSPLGEGRLLHHPVFKAIAQKHGATPAQIALAWIIRNPGVMAIPKASTTEHVKDNFGSISITLADEDVELLDIAFPAPRHKIPLAGW